MPDALEQVALFESLNNAARGDLRGIARPFAIARGETLFRQGDPPVGLHVVGSGLLEIATRMPGDEAAYVSQIVPGEVVGEFALLDDGPRSATVRAVEDTAGLLIPRPNFLALLGDGRAGAVLAIDALRALVARRTRATLERLAATPAEERELRAAPSAHAAEIAVADAGLLRSLAAFAEIGDVPLVELATSGEWIELPRSAALIDARATPDHARLVVRGAVRAAFDRDGRREQVAIHGPGEWAGLVATIDREPHPLALSVAETAVLLCVPAGRFERWRSEPGAVGAAVMAAVDRQLVRDQRRANRHLGRAIALERFNAGTRDAA